MLSLTKIWEAKLLPRVNWRLGLLGYKIAKINLDHLIHLRMTEVGIDQFYFIQVGAFDGLSNDPIADYIKNYRLRGVLIEPQSEAFAALTKNYRGHNQLELLNTAISSNNGARKLYKVANGIEGIPLWANQLASFHQENILKHKDGSPSHGISAIPSIGDHIISEEIECVTFDSILDRVGVQKIDLLLIDAEGYDSELIMLFPFGRMEPKIIQYEHMHLSEKQKNECIHLLGGKGYRFIVESTDTIAYLPHECGF